MKLKEYLDELNKMIAARPELLDMQVVFAIDEEGNGFKPVYYTPSPGFYEDYDFTGEDDEEFKPEILNAICIN